MHRRLCEEVDGARAIKVPREACGVVQLRNLGREEATFLRHALYVCDDSRKGTKEDAIQYPLYIYTERYSDVHQSQKTLTKQNK